MSNIIYKKEKFRKQIINIPYCGRCYTKLSMLGLLNQKTNKVQFYCKTCKELILK